MDQSSEMDKGIIKGLFEQGVSESHSNNIRFVIVILILFLCYYY